VAKKIEAEFEELNLKKLKRIQNIQAPLLTVTFKMVIQK
jgi:hypothetical protein